MNLLFMLLHTCLLFGLSGLAVRILLTVSGGFDLFVAVAALLSSEVAVALLNSPRFSGFGGLLLSAMLVVGAVVIAACAWARITKVIGLRCGASIGLAAFVASLGLFMLMSGLFGAIRGAGLRTFERMDGVATMLGGFPLGLGTLSGIVVTVAVMVLCVFWMSGRAGYALRLYAMDSLLAEEIGIRIGALRNQAVICAGACAAASGLSFALANGSTPELGMKVFLYGVGAALLFESRNLLSPILAGFIFGVLYVGVQLFLAPAWSEAVIFGLIVMILLWRGTSRDWSALR